MVDSQGGVHRFYHLHLHLHLLYHLNGLWIIWWTCEVESTASTTFSSNSPASTTSDDSGWEDNNILQSGAESSSPLQPSPACSKGRKSSAGPRKSRKSMSAPPNSKFEPEIPEFDNSRLSSPLPQASSQWKFVSKPYTPPSHSSRRQEVQYEDVEVPLRDEDEPDFGDRSSEYGV
ncbi:hypothetical protein F5876DRAFT_70914 [Lentinula aff. lateritia]|uniref:Uncharacterized protein n=1 Tax=Lentinula aff. lateritia TaxID=2804960 RepID=A0ACC1THD9_9AGAR|nr:hypothetical protein F5876DRAFT_70914 [Lentinula aff. lateritia]